MHTQGARRPLLRKLYSASILVPKESVAIVIAPLLESTNVSLCLFYGNRHVVLYIDSDLDTSHTFEERSGLG